MGAVFLPAIGFELPAYAADAVDPIAAVRALRAESNAAIAAHDAARLRQLGSFHGMGGGGHCSRAAVHACSGA